MVADFQLLTNSRMGCARECLRKHWLEYELGLRPDREGAPLRIGSAFHLAQETADRGEDAVAAVQSANLDPYESEVALRMFLGHRWRWQNDSFEVVAPEQGFELPLRNPETGAATPLWRVAGKMDRIVKLGDGRLALQEYKTTSDDISPGSDYWVRRRLDQQVQLYFLAAREAGYDVQAVIYDVTCRPDLRPRQIALVDGDGVKIVHDANGERVRTKDGKKWRETGDTAAGYVLQTRVETPTELGERITDDMVAHPEQYFARVEIPLLTADLAEFQKELWQQQLAIRAAQRGGAWYRNTGACQRIGVTCEYMHICARRDLETNTPEGFRRLTNVHPELATPGAIPASTATPSATSADQ